MGAVSKRGVNGKQKIVKYQTLTIKSEVHNTRNRIKLSFFVLLIVLLVGAYFVANSLFPASKPIDDDWVGISLHSLSANEAQIVNASGERWIRIDVSEELSDFNTSIKNKINFTYILG